MGSKSMGAVKGPAEDVIHAGHAGLRVSLFRKDGKLTRLELADETRGVSWADSAWDFRLALRRDNATLEASEVTVSGGKKKSDADGVTWRFVLTPCFPAAADAACRLELKLRFPNAGGRIEERITLLNGGTGELTVTALRAMHSRRADGRALSYFPIPFQECRTRPLPIDLAAATEFEFRRDGAVLMAEGGGLVVARQLADTYEEPRLIGVRRAADRISFGGVENGLPSGMTELVVGPGKSVSLGDTLYIPFSGALEDGLVRYRDHMVQCGVRVPAGYNPPLNYCIYYECRERYHHEQLRQALRRAAEIGCKLLYTDQGWEDYFGSGLWDETRLGRLEDFVAESKALGLDVGVLIGMHTDAYVWPREYWRKGADGVTLYGDKWGPGHSTGICPTVKGWQRGKTKRLQKVVEAGVRFFSFDFNDNLEPCRDAAHGHAVPLRGWEHSLGVARQQQQIKRACPSVLIEAHDWEFAGSCTWPVYLFRDGHDELWGFEFMWDPFGDFTSGRLWNLYYYNMAYELPLYLHIDLAKDSDQRVVFWYAASTVRHLGIGNYAVLDDAKKAQVRQAVAVYREHQPFFSAGKFDGLDPLTHIHTLPGQGAIVLRFNDQAEPAEGSFEVAADRLGCEGGIGAVSALVGEPARTTVVGNGRLRVEYRLRGHDVLVLRVQENA
jgi:hypothetical protein